MIKKQKSTVHFVIKYNHSHGNYTRTYTCIYRWHATTKSLTSSIIHFAEDIQIYVNCINDDHSIKQAIIWLHICITKVTEWVSTIHVNKHNIRYIIIAIIETVERITHYMFMKMGIREIHKASLL